MVNKKQISFDEVQNYVEEYNDMIKSSGYFNKWTICYDSPCIGIAPVIRSNSKDEIEIGNTSTSNFIIFPRRTYTYGKSKYATVAVEIIIKRKKEYFIKFKAVPINEYLDKDITTEWLKGFHIINRKVFSQYLKDSLHFSNEPHETIIAETNMWRIAEMDNGKTIFKLYFNDWEKIFENSINEIDILNFLKVEIDNREDERKFAVIVAYMLMAQCNLPITYLENPKKQWLNIVVGENEGMLIEILHALTKCINISPSLGSIVWQDNMIKSYYVKDEIERIIGDKFDSAFLIDNREGDITRISGILPTKGIENDTLEYMPIVISKEALDDSKFFNIDLSECKFWNEPVKGLKQPKYYQYIIKSFYKSFAKEFCHSFRSTRTIISNSIDAMLRSQKYSELREARYEYGLIKFYVCLEFIFQKYINFLEPNKDFDYKYWEEMVDDVFVNTLKESNTPITPRKRGNDIENLLRTIWELYQDNDKSRHFIDKSEYDVKNSKCEGFIHNLADGVECICLTDEWLRSNLGSSEKEMRNKIKPVALAGEYNSSFKFNESETTGQLQVKLADGNYKRFFTINTANLGKWIAANSG